ncbi:uncharacterized protein LOC130712500 [Lotus japonicus]|uniref:uncharacterized protein LOC130712500 n=1 Tax=Lotus japonicus TaxID=34305 RepID=UPI002589B728|nr:uncharacterized protein LOC130712500 [Lotus japonicus]
MCPWCGSAQETIGHALLFCPVVRRWWFASSLGLRLDSEVDFHEFVVALFSEAEMSVVAVFCQLCYTIWEARNKLIYDGVQASTEVILSRAAGLASTTGVAPAPLRDGAVRAVWTGPNEDTIKVNFDAAWADTRGASCGMVARNGAGEVMAAATRPGVDVLSPLLAEAAAFRWVMVLSMELGFRTVNFETDFKLLYDAWRMKNLGSSYLFALLSDCKDLVQFFDFCSLSFVRRTGNKVADFLAKRAGDFGDSVWIDEVPQAAMQLILDDVRALVPS